MDKFCSTIRKIPIVFLFVCFGGLIYINLDNKNFFDMDLYKILSLAIIVFVSYYLTQKKLDNRKKIEVLDNIIKTIIEATFDLSEEALKSENSKLFMMTIRNIDNKVALLERIAIDYKIVDDIAYINKESEDINNLVSNHIGDNVILISIYVDIEKHIKNIQNKCDEILFKIYFS